MKDGRCPKVILRPKDEPRFKEKNWYINEPYRSIIVINEAAYNLMLKVFKTAVQVVETAIDTVGVGVDTTLFLVKNLPYILAGGVLLFAGLQIYGIRKNGKLYGTKIIQSKIG
jgi:hypothetical protein